MKAEDLRIGNIIPMEGIELTVTFTGIDGKKTSTSNPCGAVIEITRENFSDILRDIEKRKSNGFAITEQWLYRFGFKKRFIKDQFSEFGAPDMEYYQLGDFKLILWDHNPTSLLKEYKWVCWYFIHVLDKTPIETVHQLQNIYYFITGKELNLIK